MKYKMIVSDLDGTLLKSRTHKPSDFTLNTIRELVDMGVVFVPSSGRSIDLMAKKLFENGCQYAICTNGTKVFDMKDKTLLREYRFDEKTLEKLFDFGEERGDLFTVVANKPLFDRNNLQKIIDWFGGVREEFHNMVDDLRSYVLDNDIHIGKFEIFLDHELLESTMDAYREMFPELNVTTAGYTNVEVLPKGCDKANAVLYLSELLGIDRNEVIVMGDSENDVGMLKVGGLRLVPSDGTKAAKDEADVITGKCDEDGIAKQLRKIYGLD